MPNSAVRCSVSSLVVLGFSLSLSLSAIAQTSLKPLRASEVMALEAGGALQSNIAHDIAVRGLSFHPDDEFLAQLKKVGADAAVLAAMKAAKVSADDVKPDKELVQELSSAGLLVQDRHYYEAATELSRALKSSFAGPETGFVMGDLLRRQSDFPQAAAVYAEVLREDATFPEVHTKASFILGKLGDSEDALSEANAALALNPEDAEAHKNAALALDNEQKFDGAIAEYKEALRIKPDYAVARYDLGLLYQHMQSYDDAIAEYKKAITLDPTFASAHINLGHVYQVNGDIPSAIREFREAKRVDPNEPVAREGLGSQLMSVAPVEAIKELRELEKMFPDFEMCHVCLAHGLIWQGDMAGAEAELKKAEQLEPTDPEPHTEMGKMREKEKNYDGALTEFRAAERLGPNEGDTHADVARILLITKDSAGALAELKQAETLAPSSWQIHEQYGMALVAGGETDLAISELKEAVSLDPKQSQVIVELGSALEKKGNWVGALEQYRRAALADAALLAKAQPGQQIMRYEPDPQKAYKEAKARFADYLVSLKAAGKASEAAELEKRVGMLDTSAGTLEKVQALMQSGDLAMRDRNVDGAEKSFKEAVALAEKLPPGDENLIVALGKMGNVYGMKQDYADAGVMFHRQLAIIEKTFGANSPRTADPLRYLGNVAAGSGNFVEAESYFKRALDVNVNAFGENSTQTSEGLRMLAGLYMAQSQWDKAEPYLVRAVKVSEAAVGPDDNMVLMPLWGLCDLYDREGKPERSQPCWHRATEIMAKQFGESSPNLAQSLTSESNALRQLGKKDEADAIEERLRKIHRTAN
jgi:tetratricopeptide (TPR) repeat protein